jgi:hypothetical protein
MNVQDYSQLRAFARVDGLKLFVLWLVSFVCYVGGLNHPGLGLVAIMLAFITPFLSARLLRKYRDEVLQGTLKFGRGWFYVVLQFFHASVLFAVAQFIYFAFIDKGYFMDTLSEMLLAPENKEALKALGMQGLEETLTMMRQMRPIDQVLNILMSNLLIGCLVGVPIAAFCKKEK